MNNSSIVKIKLLRCMRFEVTTLNTDKAHFYKTFPHICHITVRHL